MIPLNPSDYKKVVTVLNYTVQRLQRGTTDEQFHHLGDSPSLLVKLGYPELAETVESRSADAVDALQDAAQATAQDLTNVIAELTRAQETKA